MSGTQRYDDDLFWTICIHEAGHAVAAAALEQTPIIVTAGRYRNEEAKNIYLRDNSKPHVELVVVLSGLVAEKLFIGQVAKQAYAEDDTDNARAWRLAERFAPDDPESLVEKAIDASAKILENRHEQVIEIAEKLHDRGMVLGFKVTEIVPPLDEGN